MRNTTLFFLLAGCLLSFLHGQAQTPGATIKGKVLDASGKPVAQASVFLDKHNLGTTAHADGSFVIRHIPEGSYTVTAHLMGFKDEQRFITAKGDSVITLLFSLEEELLQVDEVVISTDRTQSKTQELKESAYTVNAIETKSYQNTTADLNQILDKSTGVRVRQSGGVGSDYNFSINGLSGNAIKYFIDGIPIESMGSTMTLNNIPVNLAKRVEVYKGVVPVDFGADAMGGIVNVVTNQSIRNYLDASYSFGSFNTHRAALSGQYTHDSTGIVLRASSFFNFSKNNYLMREVEVFDPIQRKYVNKEFRRFHDDYLSAMGQLEVGVLNKKWADVFFIGGSYSLQNNDIQTGATQNRVYGGAERRGFAYSTSLRYKKHDFLVKNLNLKLFASLVTDKYRVIDTTYRKYEWDQSSQAVTYAEMTGGNRNLYHYTRPKQIVNANLSYELSPVHSFNLNYLFSGFGNQSFDEYNNTPPSKDRIHKHIVGLAYQQELLNKRWTNTFFVKQYTLNIAAQMKTTGRVSTLTGSSADASSSTTNYGYGIASRYKLGKGIGIKASYEHAYRLQSPDESLGDGLTLIANFNLKPENSDNINVGAFIGRDLGKNQRHKFFFEAAWFYRNAKDFIYLTPIPEIGVSQYKNVSNVKIDGFEAELKYAYNNLFSIDLNASYQNAINTSRGSKDVPEVTYLNRIPNRPWIFGNANFGIGKNDLLGKATRIQFNWDLQYVHWFYLTWEAFGSKASKATIPSQVIQNAALTYSMKNGRYNLSLECKNLTNALAYDNFKLQKPGIAWYIKARIFLN